MHNTVLRPIEGLLKSSELKAFKPKSCKSHAQDICLCVNNDRTSRPTLDHSRHNVFMG